MHPPLSPFAEPPEPIRRRARLAINLTPAERDMAHRLAERDGLTVNEMVRRMLAERLAESERTAA